MDVLVVEDEFWIRQGILKAIDWAALGMRLCGQAQNGLEALQIVDGHCPDIIITDMKMPGMNGDELLRELAGRGYRGGLIVLSEYSSYDYMRQAIRSQVDEYMLKPIDEEELNGVLRRIRDRLTHFPGQEPPAARLLEELARGEGVSRFTPLQEPCVIGCLWADHLRAVPFPSSLREGIALFLRPWGEHEALLACTGGAEGVQAPLEAACEAWSAASGGGVYCGLSSPLRTGREKEALLQARMAAGYAAPHRRVIPYKEAASQGTGKPVTLLLAASLGPLLESLKPEGVQELAARLARPLAEQGLLYLPVLHNALLEMNMLLDRHCRALGAHVPALTGQGDRICKVRSLPQAQAYIAIQFRAALEALRPIRAAQNGDVVEQMAAYLKEHYAEDVNLLSLSEQYHINYIYLSRLFKKRTGKNFTEYLLELRMNAAKDLLSQGTLLVKDVAELVGYSNPYYFTTSYQRYFHRLPSDDQPPAQPGRSGGK